MNGLDWVIVLILVLSVAAAAVQGFFFAIFTLAGAILGYVVAAWEYRAVAPWFLPYVKSEWVAEAVAFFVIFLVIVILAGIAGRIARWAMKEVGLRWFDRVLGAVFGLLRGAIVVTVLVMAMAAFGPGSRLLAESQLGSYFLVVGRAAAWVAPYDLREGFRRGVQAVRDFHNASESAPANNQKPAAADGKQQ